MGVATGIVQEFEFGMNWADYSRFVGNVFGSLLAAEGVFAFFLEGGFLGLMLFGGNRLGPRLWLFATSWSCSAPTSAPSGSSWPTPGCRRPQGYTIATDPAPARAVMTDFWQVVFTPSFMPAAAARVRRVVDGRGRADDERQRLLRAQEAAPRARQCRTSRSACRRSSCSRRPTVRVFGAATGDRGHQQAAAQAGLDGRALWRAPRAPRCTSWAGWTRRPRRRPGSRSRACSASWPT